MFSSWSEPLEPRRLFHGYTTLDEQGIVPNLELTATPASFVVGTTLTPVLVDIEDSSADIIPSDNSDVTISLLNSSGIAQPLNGTTTVAAVNGVATFSDLSIPNDGKYYFMATDGADTAGTGNSFTVIQPPTALTPVMVSAKTPGSILSSAALRGTEILKLVNDSDAPVTGAFTTTVYATTDGAIDSSAIAVSKSVISVAHKLAVGKSLPVHLTIATLPAALADGTYTLLAQTTDASNDISSPDDGPVVQVQPATVTLFETFTRLVMPASVISGSKTSVSATLKITNTGNIVDPNRTSITLYASPDYTIANATPIVTVDPRLPVGANGKSLAIHIPFGVWPADLSGSYQILAQVTDGQGNVTTSYSDDFVTISAPFVNISNSVATGPVQSTFATGHSAVVTLVLHNDGNVNAIGTLGVNFGASTDGSTDTVSAVQAKTIPVFHIAKGGMTKLRLVVELTPAEVGETLTIAADISLVTADYGTMTVSIDSSSFSVT